MEQVTKIVFKDYYREFFKWLLYISIFLVVIRITVYVVSYFNEESSLSHFLSFSMDPMSIGMMILGIISIYGFLPQSIKLGATRKAFYLGIVYTVLALTISYAVLNLILTATEYAVVQRFTIESIALSDIWHYLITLFLSFLFGMIIALAYYRYGWKVGLVLTLVFITTREVFEVLAADLFDRLFGASYYLLGSSLGDIMLIGLLLWLCYRMIRDVPIKM